MCCSACASAAAAVAAAGPELIVLTTPHGMALPEAVAVYSHESLQGTGGWAGEWGDFTVAGEVRVLALSLSRWGGEWRGGSEGGGASVGCRLRATARRWRSDRDGHGATASSQLTHAPLM